MKLHRMTDDPTLLIKHSREGQPDSGMDVGAEDFALVVYRGNRSLAIDWNGTISVREREDVQAAIGKAS